MRTRSREDGRFYPWVTVGCSCTGCASTAVAQVGYAASHPDGVYLCEEHHAQFRERYPDAPHLFGTFQWTWRQFIGATRIADATILSWAGPIVRLVARVRGQEGAEVFGRWYQAA